MKIDPFDHKRFIGYVSRVAPDITQVHFPNSRLLKKFYYDGDILHGGVVRNFVIIEGEGHGFLAKIVSVELPEKERSFLSEAAFQNEDKMHPIGKVEIQLCFEIFGEVKAVKGLDQYPPVGSKVYACSPQLLQKFLKDFGKVGNCSDLLELATLPQDKGYPVKISANALFGRHCAIVGTTGGGKSYTIAKLARELQKKDNAKVILLDATGEFDKFGDNLEIGENCHFHYKNLQEEDFFALFRPAGQVQAPILQEALKSLRTVALIEGLASGGPSGVVIDSGMLIKKDNNKSALLNFQNQNSDKVDDIFYPFNIKKLQNQIINECVYDSGRSNPLVWGDINTRDKDNCSSLILRIGSLLNNSLSNSIFNFQKNLDGSNECIIKKIDNFIKDENTTKIMRINLRKIPKDSDVSSILVNAIGRFLLKKASDGNFNKKDKERPVIVFLDEAHLFLNKKIKDEYSIETELNSFERIAKECRKYGLFLCLSTQRPRDIPQGVLSQMGTFIAHRLINHFDKEAIENASPEGSKYILSFLPSLGQGEAILMGVDFPMPINIKIKKVSEKYKPNSDTPKLFSKEEEEEEEEEVPPKTEQVPF